MADPQKILSKISEARSSMIREQEAQSIRNSQRSSAAIPHPRPNDYLQREDSWTVPPQYDQPRTSTTSAQMPFAPRGMGDPSFNTNFPGGGGSNYAGSMMSGIDSYYGGGSQIGYQDSTIGYSPNDMLTAQQRMAQQQALQQQQAQSGRMWFIEGLHDDHLRMA